MKGQRMTCHRIALLASTLFLTALTGSGTQNVPPAVERYERVRDILFATDEFYPRAYSLLLRYAPSFSGEEQIQISKVREGYRIVHTFLPKGAKSIGEQMAAFSQRTGNYRVEDIAAHIKVSRRVLDVSAEIVDGAINDLHKITMVVPESVIVVDGTRYDFRFENTGKTFRMHYSFTDEDFGAPHYRYQLAEWMNTVKALAEKQQ